MSRESGSHGLKGIESKDFGVGGSTDEQAPIDSDQDGSIEHPVFDLDHDIDDATTEKPPDEVETGNARSSDAPPPPNGGYGWLCVACCALINAQTWGINAAYSVFLAHYLATNAFPGATAVEYAFVGSLSLSMSVFVSPVVTITTRKFGTRTTLLVGVVLETLALIGASFARQIWHLFLSQGICFGVGIGFLFVGSVGIVPQWFTTRRSLANGIATAGSGLGGLVYSLAAGAMIQTIGLPWAFRVFGILAFTVNFTCAMLLRDRNKIIGSSQLAFDTKLFKRAEYVLLLGFAWFSMLGYAVLLYSLANYANSIGLSASQAANISALLNLGQALGRPPIGYFSDSIGRINMAGLMTALCGLFALVIWTFANSYGVLIFYSIVGGAVAGTFWTTIAPLTAEVVGLRNVPSALSILWLVIVLPSTFSEPIALEIVERTGSYLGTQLFTGFMYIAAALCILFVRGWKIGEVAEIAAAQGTDPREIDVVTVGAADDAVSIKARSIGRKSMWRHCLKWRKV